MEPNAQDLLAGGGVAAAVMALLFWAVRTLVGMFGKHLERMEATVKEFAGDVKGELSAIRVELGEVKAATRQTADQVAAIAYARGDVTPPPTPLPSAGNGKKRSGI